MAALGAGRAGLNQGQQQGTSAETMRIVGLVVEQATTEIYRNQFGKSLMSCEAVG